MKITVLCENSVGYGGAKVCKAEWGLSLFIKHKDSKILMDTGRTTVYKKNAKALGIDLNEIDFIVLSHHHGDHVGGIKHHEFSSDKKLILHPHTLEKDNEGLYEGFDLVQSTKPLEFSEDIFYLGEVPRKNDFEKGEHRGDPMLDDSAIAIKTDKGVVVISGCSHSGICNICEYAKEVTGQNLYAVVGGFHLFDNEPGYSERAIEETMKYFQKENPKYLYPMHCVDFPTLAKMHTIFGCEKLCAGDTIEL